MDILEELEKKDIELITCYSLMQLQQNEIKKLSEQVEHLEKLLLHKAHLIEPKKD